MILLRYSLYPNSKFKPKNQFFFLHTVVVKMYRGVSVAFYMQKIRQGQATAPT